MQTIDRKIAHRELVTKHNTMIFRGENGRLSLRKGADGFTVRIQDNDYKKVTKTTYKTMAGCLVAADTLKEFYLL